MFKVIMRNDTAAMAIGYGLVAAGITFALAGTVFFAGKALDGFLFSLTGQL